MGNNTIAYSVSSNKYGHLMNDLDVPTQDDDGVWSSYAKCSRSGAIENTNEAIKNCPGSQPQEQYGSN